MMMIMLIVKIFGNDEDMLLHRKVRSISTFAYMEKRKLTKIVLQCGWWGCVGGEIKQLWSHISLHISPHKTKYISTQDALYISIIMQYISIAYFYFPIFRKTLFKQKIYIFFLTLCPFVVLAY